MIMNIMVTSYALSHFWVIYYIYIGMMMIRLGESDVIMAGGVDITSDASINIRAEVRKAMIDISYVS